MEEQKHPQLCTNVRRLTVNVKADTDTDRYVVSGQKPTAETAI